MASEETSQVWRAPSKKCHRLSTTLGRTRLGCTRADGQTDSSAAAVAGEKSIVRVEAHLISDKREGCHSSEECVATFLGNEGMRGVADREGGRARVSLSISAEVARPAPGRAARLASSRPLTSPNLPVWTSLNT